MHLIVDMDTRKSFSATPLNMSCCILKVLWVFYRDICNINYKNTLQLLSNYFTVYNYRVDEIIAKEGQISAIYI